MFNTFFYQPILNLVVALYNYLPGHDMALVIVCLVIIINLALWPLGKKMLVSQKQMQDLQPRIDELKKIHKDNKQEFSKATMELYQKEKVNPFSGCLVLIVQLPFFWAIFSVFRNTFDNKDFSNLIYPFISNPGHINTIVFNGYLDFSKPNIVLAVLAAGSQLVKVLITPQPKVAVNEDGTKDEASMATMMSKQMMYMAPLITLIACVSFPSGLAFYWLCFTLFSIAQQLIIFRKNKDNSPEIVDIKEGDIKKVENIEEIKELK